MTAIIRITDFYAKIYISSIHNDDVYTYLLTINKQGDDIKYLKPLKFEYYEMCDDDPFNCMLYEKDKINSLNIGSYEEIYHNCIESLFNKYSNDLKRCKQIMIVYDDNVLNVFGKDLYFNTFDILGNENDIKIEYKHIKNIIPGEVMNIELGYQSSMYRLEYVYKNYMPWYVNKANICPDLIGKEDKELVGCIVNTEKKEHRKVIDKYFMLIDFNAYNSNYYVYKLSNRVVTLYHYSQLQCGFMNLIEWLADKTDYDLSKYVRFKKFISSLSYLSSNDGFTNVDFNYKTVNVEDYFVNSPIKSIIDTLINIKHQILKEHQFDKKVYIKYCVENVVETHLKHIELKEINFNGNKDRLLMCYKYLEGVQNKTIEFIANYSSAALINKKTNSSNFTLKIPYSELGYEYSFEDIE